MKKEIHENNLSEVQQLSQSVAELARSLERSEQQNRKMQKIFSVILFAFVASIATLAISKGALITDVYAENNADNSSNDSINNMLQQFAPVLRDLGILVTRVKQDSDIARARALMRSSPNKYPPGTRIDQFSSEELNSFEASDALVVGTIAEEIHFINDSLKQMNFSISVMAHNMDETMGRMSDFMP